MTGCRDQIPWWPWLVDWERGPSGPHLPSATAAPPLFFVLLVEVEPVPCPEIEGICKIIKVLNNVINSSSELQPSHSCGKGRSRASVVEVLKHPSPKARPPPRHQIDGIQTEMGQLFCMVSQLYSKAMSWTIKNTSLNTERIRHIFPLVVTGMHTYQGLGGSPRLGSETGTTVHPRGCVALASFMLVRGTGGCAQS